MKKEAQVLDVGCGDGYGTYKLSSAGYKAVGVDLSEVMIQKVRSAENNRIYLL